MRPSRFLAGVLLCVLPCGVRPIPPPEPERCHVHTHGTALRETFVASRDGPAGNASARELCYARVMAMPATMCTRESTVRELCSHSYIFIGGLFHSGTGAIRTALAAAAPSRVSVHSNTHRIEDEGKYMQTVYVVNRNRDARLWHCAFLESKRDESQHPPHTPGALRKDEADALSLNPRGSALLFSQWARFWDTRMPILVEKSPMNLVRTRFLASLFPEMASFAVIVRHPFGTCAMQLKSAFKLFTAQVQSQRSQIRRGRPGVDLSHVFRRLDSIVKSWADLYGTFETDAKHVRRSVMVRFEALLSDPHEAARRTLLALGLRPDDTRGRSLNFDKWATGIDARKAYEWAWQYAEQFSQLQLLSSAGTRGAQQRGSQWEALVRNYEGRAGRYGYSLSNFTNLGPPTSPLVCI
mmetsp:Transcript_5878/g.15377  ORF Transcript_5878/g.15377 Transcript_5878/m.15377 type:complete len:411 (+) Transcript_5878:261-1493(+)